MTRRALVVALGTIPFGCDDLDNIDVDVSGTAEIPGATILDELIGLVPFEGFDSIDFQQEFANQGVTEDQVDSVKVKSFVITVESPSDGTLDFLDSLAFFASAQGQEEVRIASAAAVADGSRTLELDIDDVELLAYATAPSMVIRAAVEGRRPDDDTRIRADVVFDVDIRIPGC